MPLLLVGGFAVLLSTRAAEGVVGANSVGGRGKDIAVAAVGGGVAILVVGTLPPPLLAFTTIVAPFLLPARIKALPLLAMDEQPSSQAPAPPPPL